MNHNLSYLIATAALVCCISGLLQAEQLRTQGRFFDRAADHKITVAYIYEGCHHQPQSACVDRKATYHRNRKMFFNVSLYPELVAANVYFLTLDTSRYRVKTVKEFLDITSPDTFIVFVDGMVVSYEYLTGCPSEATLLTYIKSLVGDQLKSCQKGTCALRKECYNGCKDPQQDPLGNPSWYAAGYYGVMGGEPPLGYGMATSGYSFSMGFRRLPN